MGYEETLKEYRTPKGITKKEEGPNYSKYIATLSRMVVIMESASWGCHML